MSYFYHELVPQNMNKVYTSRGAILEKRYDAHPPSRLVVSAGQQKRSQKLGDFFADPDFGSTSGRGCLISIINHSLCIVCKFASNSDTDPMSAYSVAAHHCLWRSVSAKYGLGQIS